MRVRRSVRAFLAALPPVVAFVVWVTAAGLAARAAPRTLTNYPRLAEFAVYGIAAMGGIGGLIAFWYSADSIEFLVLGYRIRRVTATSWVYEERGPNGALRALPFGYTPLAAGYRPPCQVHLPSEHHWDGQMPSWARGRRDEIVGNISRELGAGFGTRVEIVESPDVE